MASAKDKMETQEAEIEKEEVDTTAEKAKEIGKIADAKEEDLPDYEVVEEEDKTLAKEREDRPKQERKQLTNKEKRDLRKKRVQEKFQAKDAEIENLRQENERIKRRQDEIDGRLHGINKAEVDNAWNVNVANFNKAEKEHEEAFKEGDGAKATKAMREMYTAQQNIDKLQNLKQQLEKQPAKPQAEQLTVDPVVTRKAQAWASKHEWYRADGSDEDSEIAKVISGKMVNEGYDPKSDDFWEELDDRLEKRGIGVMEDEEEEEETPAPVKRRAPPVSGGAKRADVNGKVQVTLPTVYIQHLKDKGWWDDPVMKKKMISRYLETQKQNNN